MFILSADTTTDINTIAITHNEELIAEISINAGKRHSERLIPLVDFLLNEVRLTIDQINVLAISIGPGSFTGLRVGLASWKGLALAKSIPLVGVPTLSAFSRLGLFKNAIVCPILDARMKEIFGGIFVFDNDGTRKTIRENFLGSIADFLSHVQETHQQYPYSIFIFGNACNLYKEAITNTIPQAILGEPWWSHPRASAVAREALHLWNQGYTMNVNDILPIYLRLSQPEEKQKRCQSPTT